MASAKHIPALASTDGSLISSWDGMANQAVAFFSTVLGRGPQEAAAAAPSLAQRNEILDVVSDRLSEEDKARLNAPFELRELQEAAMAMKKLKCPGPDGVPVELFQIMWAKVGPLILRVLNEGIASSAFHEKFSQGLIVLLPKKGDQKILTNKRPITLLNVVYKIGAKVMQRPLTPILQKVISPQQSAFLPGRNIHHSHVMLGEMLHQAAKSGEDYVILKLYVVKAFDKMEWPFLLAVLEKAGFSGTLTGFLLASFASASSAILLNGIATCNIPLARSVRQGCPLSPLLFILAFDVLSSLLQKAIDDRRIEGVIFPETGTHSLHNMYADDTTVVMRARAKYARELQAILKLFGDVSGLVCAWEQTIASVIPRGPPPLELWLFPWRWEDDEGASNSLGIPTAQTLSVERIETTLITKFQGRIDKLRERHLTLAARVVIANSLLLGCIWFMLTVWAGKKAFLKQIQRLVDRFVWKGRSWVSGSTTALPREDDGLNLLGVEAHYKALTGKFILWLMMGEFHTLRSILLNHIQAASWRRWGSRDLTWIVSKCGRIQMNGSAPWQAICKGWEDLKKWLRPNTPANEEEWQNLPIWRPQCNHILPALARCNTAKQRILRDLGINRMADVLDPTGALITWEERTRRGANQSCERAFCDLRANLKEQPELCPPDEQRDIYLEGFLVPGYPTIWQFKLPANRLSEDWIPHIHRGEPERTFRREGSLLHPTTLSRPGPELVLHRVIVGRHQALEFAPFLVPGKVNIRWSSTVGLMAHRLWTGPQRNYVEFRCCTQHSHTTPSRDGRKDSAAYFRPTFGSLHG